MNHHQIKVVGFDADDTLWENEMLFRDTEKAFYKLMAPYEVEHRLSQELFKTEIENLGTYGYGIKGFTLSMLETSLKVSGYRVTQEIINEIIQLGRKMLSAPVKIINHVPETLAALGKKYRLIMVTKGDLLEQQRKLRVSNLESYFHHIEILSDKTPAQYKKLLDHLDIPPEEFVMVGNSLKSDVLPPITIGCQAVHIPFHTTWAHEQVSQEEKEHVDYLELGDIKELLNHF
jgi:putative hydrolase of the HAD superfamily